MKRILKFLDAGSLTLAVIWLVAVIAACVAVALLVPHLPSAITIICVVFLLGGGLDSVGIIFFSKKSSDSSRNN